MPLTPELTTRIRTWVGDPVPPTDADLSARYDALEHSAKAVVTEVLRKRLAEFEAQPASVSIPGEVAVNHAANLAALRARIESLDNYDDDLIVVVGADGSHPITMQRLVRKPRR